MDTNTDSNLIVSAYIENDNGLLLMQFLKKIKPNGAWAFPGGRVKQSEDIKQALIREVKEEIGINIEVFELIGVADFQWSESEYNVNLLYKCKIISGEIVNLEPTKIDLVEYRSKEDIPRIFKFL